MRAVRNGIGPSHLYSIIGYLMVAAILMLGAMSVAAQEAKQAAGLEQLKFLEGDWVGEGGGGPGQGTGEFTFIPDLKGKVFVRKNFAEYPATKDKPAFRHDDLMIVHQKPGDTIRATYWDSEGNTINYTVSVAPDQKSAVFVSEPSANAPRFRLTYKMKDDKNLAINFEIAPPGQPEAFSPYIEAAAHKK